MYIYPTAVYYEPRRTSPQYSTKFVCTIHEEMPQTVRQVSQNVDNTYLKF